MLRSLVTEITQQHLENLSTFQKLLCVEHRWQIRGDSSYTARVSGADGGGDTVIPRSAAVGDATKP